MAQTADAGSYPFPYPPFHLVSQRRDWLSFAVFAKTLCDDVLTWAGRRKVPEDGGAMTMRGCLPQVEGGGKNVVY